MEINEIFYKGLAFGLGSMINNAGLIFFTGE
jgi:hypothetical protein